MAPVPAPNGSFISPFPVTLADTVVTVYPNGEDDWDNLQYVLNQLANKNDTRLVLVKGTYFHRYALFAVDTRVTIQGAGQEDTVLQSGTTTSTCLPLDSADQAIYNPSGVPPAQITTRAVAMPLCSLDLRDLTLSSSQLKGHTAYATQFGFPDPPNIKNGDVIGLVQITGQNPVLSVNNFPLTMTGVVPQPTGSTNLVQPQLRDAPDVGTINYEEGVDFTVNRATGFFTRIATGAITSGQVVYATWNNVKNLTDVSRVNFDAERCTFRGNRLAVDGALYNSVETGLYVYGGFSYGPDLPGDVQCFHNETYLDVPSLAGKIYSKEETFPHIPPIPDELQAPQTPLCGTIRVVDCVFQDLSGAVFVNGLERTQVGGPYNFLSQLPERSSLEIRGNTFRNIGSDTYGFQAIFIDEVSGLDINITQNVFDTCFGIIDTGFSDGYGLGLFGGTALRLPGWLGAPNTMDLGFNVASVSRALLPALYQSFYLNLFPITVGTSHLPLGTPPIFNEGVLNVHDNVIEWMITPPSVTPPPEGSGGILFYGLATPLAQNNRLISRTNNQASAGVKVDSGTVIVTDNDMELWQMRAGAVNIAIGADSVNTRVTALAESDTIRIDPAAVGTVVTGGTVVP